MALAAAAFIAAASAGSVSPSAVYATPRRLVAVDGARRLNLYCTGSGNPTVLLDAGSGNWMATWRHVQEEIGESTRACAYDRAGLGFSDAAGRPSDLRNIVDDLHRLVEASPIATPFVYVGHSLAGAIGLLYVATLSRRHRRRRSDRARVRRPTRRAAGAAASRQARRDRPLVPPSSGSRPYPRRVAIRT